MTSIWSLLVGLPEIAFCKSFETAALCPHTKDAASRIVTLVVMILDLKVFISSFRLMPMHAARHFAMGRSGDNPVVYKLGDLLVGGTVWRVRTKQERTTFFASRS